VAQEVCASLILKTPRLNGWARIGIVLSVVWAICGSIWVLHSISDTDEIYGLYNICLTEPKSDPGVCKQELEKLQAAVGWEARWALVWFVFAPIPVFWLIAYGLVALVRWMRRGFSPS
jgi:hypothetical protein